MTYLFDKTLYRCQLILTSDNLLFLLLLLSHLRRQQECLTLLTCEVWLVQERCVPGIGFYYFAEVVDFEFGLCWSTWYLRLIVGLCLVVFLFVCFEFLHHRRMSHCFTCLICLTRSFCLLMFSQHGVDMICFVFLISVLSLFWDVFLISYYLLFWIAVHMIC